MAFICSSEDATFFVWSTDRAEGSRLSKDLIPASLRLLSFFELSFAKLGKIIIVELLMSSQQTLASLIMDTRKPRCLRRAGPSHPLEFPTCASLLRPIPNNALLWVYRSVY